MIEKAFKFRYLIVFIVFSAWTLFFDSHNAFVLNEQLNAIEELTTQQTFYKDEIQRLTSEKENLFSDINNLEKFGREKFRMKKPEEDLYIVERKEGE